MYIYMYVYIIMYNIYPSVCAVTSVNIDLHFKEGILSHEINMNVQRYYKLDHSVADCFINKLKCSLVTTIK